MDALAARFDLARRLAREAGARLLAFSRDRLEVSAKGAQDFVTAADRAVETMIRRAVADAFPGDSVLGEEEGGATADRLWVVDPIDGTINFIRGMPSFAVSIAYVEQGTVELGAVQIPLLGETFTARRGHGAFCNDRAIRVSHCTRLADARIAAGYAQRGSKAQHLRFLGDLMRAGSDILKVNSAAVCLAMTAAGRIDGYFERELMSWDVLGGQILVREAGGVTNDFGAHGLTRKDHAFACGPALASELRRAARI